MAIRIYSGPDTDRVIDELDEAIGKSDPRVYQRTGQLAIVRGMLEEDAKRLGIAFCPDDLILAPLKRENLLPVISRHIEYGADVVNGDGLPHWKRQVPNSDVTGSFLQKDFWGHIRTIRGISQTPIIHLDGSIVRNGYDPETRYLVASSVSVDHVFENVTITDAKVALSTLLEPFAEFPFVTEESRHAAAGLVLTLLLRPCIRGNVPLFVVRAPQKNCGKSLVAKIACIIATGHIPAANTWPGGEEEREKVLSSAASAALPILFFDNVDNAGSIGGAAIDKVATCDGETAFRVLGRTEHKRLPWPTVVIFTANRARIEGDTDRRSLVLELIRPNTAPDRYAHPDVLGYAKENRARLLGAAFTLIRAWVQAGKPDMGIRRCDSFEDWSGTVPSILAWATDGAVNIRTLVQDVAGTDTDEVEFRLLETLAAYLDAFNLEALSVKKLVGRVFGEEVGGGSGLTQVQRDRKADLKDAIDALECTVGRGDARAFDNRKFGKRLASMHGVFYPPYRLEKAGTEQGLIRWTVTRVKGPGTPPRPEPTPDPEQTTDPVTPADPDAEYLDDILG